VANYPQALNIHLFIIGDYRSHHLRGDVYRPRKENASRPSRIHHHWRPLNLNVEPADNDIRDEIKKQDTRGKTIVSGNVIRSISISLLSLPSVRE